MSHLIPWDHRPATAACISWSILVVLGISACSGGPSAANPPQAAPEATPGAALTTGSPPPMSLADTTPRPKPDDCPRLESMLATIARDPDPIALARQLSMPLDESQRIQVLITLASDAAADVTAYGATVTKQSGATAQAFVPIDQLCALSNDPTVLMVRSANIAQTTP